MTFLHFSSDRAGKWMKRKGKRVKKKKEKRMNGAGRSGSWRGVWTKQRRVSGLVPKGDDAGNPLLGR